MLANRETLLAVILAVLTLFGCGRKEEATPENSTIAASRSSVREPAQSGEPAEPVPAARGPEAMVGGVADSAIDGNRPPQVVDVPFKEPRIHRGVDIEVTPEGFDPDGDLVSFRFEWFINGEKLIDFDEPVLSGERFQKGDRIALRIIPTDGKVDGLPFTGQPFTVPNAPPHFVSTPPLQFQAQGYVYEARAEDPDEEAVTYHLETGPEGMTIDSDTGRVSWPIGQDQTGEHMVRLVAQDEDGLQTVQEYSLTIRIDKQEGN